MTSEHNARLAVLRARLRVAGLDGFIVPRADEHLGEYVPASAERLLHLTGFSGSAGLAIVLADKAAIFSDGRYTTQLVAETDGGLWERLHVTDTPPAAWLKEHGAGQRIGYDPWLISADGLARFSGVELVAVERNPIDDMWEDRPAPPMAPAVLHDVAFAGEAAAAKRERLAAVLREAGQAAAILSDPAALAWLFNLRGADVPFTPVALGFAILHSDATAVIFMPGAKLSAAVQAELGQEVRIAERAELGTALAALSGKTVRYDPASQPVWLQAALTAAGAKIAAAPDLVALPRACKNEVEQAGARAAHVRDGVAVVKFLAWLSHAKGETEMSAAAYLLRCRAQGEHFQGESFAAISGAGEHGAIIHYRVTTETDRTIRPDEVYLIDSGGQYLEGTTDITRTVWTGPHAAPPEIRGHATRVLAGHIALTMAVFPQGVAGVHLDALARTALWQAGLDYDHGTGHGVGAYLSVHEGPAGISRAGRPVPLQAGMILSNEPGYYLPGAYGIRLENLLLVQPAAFPKFLRFETLTLAPFDRALIDPALLPPAALAWLNAYHARVAETLAPHLDAATAAWLAAATAVL